MALTISVTLEDDDVEHFIDKYNEDAGTDITVDMIHQNPELHQAIAADMVMLWYNSFDGEEVINAYDLYGEFFNHEDVLTLPGDPVLGVEEDEHDQ